MNKLIHPATHEAVSPFEMIYGGIGVAVLAGWGAAVASKEVASRLQVEFPRFWRNVICPDTTVDAVTGMPQFDTGYVLNKDLPNTLQTP